MAGKSAPAMAMELFSAPALADRLRRAPPHEDVITIIKAAAGDEAALDRFPEHVSADPERAREAAAFYLQQVHLRPEASDHQVLGLEPTSSLEKLKEHKRWLLKWLHPDRNNNRWEQAYFERIVAAAARIEQEHALPAGVQPPAAPPPRRQHRNASAMRFAATRPGLKHKRGSTGSKITALVALFVLMSLVVFGHQLAALIQTYFGGASADGLALGSGN
jgi:hypothetical protein